MTTPAVPVRAAVLTSLLGAVTVTVLGMSGSPAAVPVGAFLSGSVAVAGGRVAVHGALRGREVITFTVLLGAAAFVYGVGRLLLGVLVAAGGAAFPTPGDVVSTMSVPLAIAGLALLARRGGDVNAGSSLGLDAVMLGSAAALLLWRVAFRGVLAPEVGGSHAVVSAVLLADLMVLALVLIAAAREPGRALLLALAGMGLYAGADLVTTYAVVPPGGAWPWSGMALASAAWPLLVAGLLTTSATPMPRPQAWALAAEARGTLVAAVAVCLLLVAFLWSLFADLTLDPVSVALAILLVLAYAGGETLRARNGERLLRRVRAQALADPLTGLGNRRALSQELARGGGGHRSVLTLDLDGFKQVNGLLGHTAGDRLLVAVAGRLTAVCDADDAPVYRLGGDEFAVVADTDLAGAERLGARMVESVRGAWREVPASAAVDMSACVGVADGAAAPGGDHLAALTTSATALRAAKQAGRGSVVVYTSVLAGQARRRELVEHRLRRALRFGDLEMHFQPIVDLSTGALMGLEALARWEDDELGRVSPEEFVPIAEQTGLVVEFGTFALRRSIEVLARSGAAAAGLNVGLNASAIELRSPSYADEVVRVLHQHAVPPQRLVLEVTESLFLAEDDPALRTLRALVDLGVAVAIDDFGTGYSSLAYLHRLPVHVLKIDRSLTAELYDPRIRAVTSTIVELGCALGIDVVVEGVETPQMAATARSLGARIGQGWLFSRAVPASEVPALLGRRFDVGRPIDVPASSSP